MISSPRTYCWWNVVPEPTSSAQVLLPHNHHFVFLRKMNSSLVLSSSLCLPLISPHRSPVYGGIKLGWACPCTALRCSSFSSSGIQRVQWHWPLDRNHTHFLLPIFLGFGSFHPPSLHNSLTESSTKSLCHHPFRLGQYSIQDVGIKSHLVISTSDLFLSRRGVWNHISWQRLTSDLCRYRRLLTTLRYIFLSVLKIL